MESKSFTSCHYEAALVFLSSFFFLLPSIGKGGQLDPTAVNILQQIIELGSEPHEAAAVASVVAVAPGTVTVVKQVKKKSFFLN